MQKLDSCQFLEALLRARRPGAEKILAFYDSRVGAICRDPRLLLVPLDDHMCHRGDAVFESIAYRERKLFALDAHIARLARSAARMALNPPVPFSEIKETVVAVARAGERDHGDIRVLLSRGPGGFGVSPSECPQAGLYIVALATELPNPEIYSRGLTAFESAIPPKQDYLATIKTTNYLPNVLMAMEAAHRNMDVAITFDSNGHIAEAAIANIAIVDHTGCLRSPQRESILAGTTLLAALQLAPEKMPVREGIIHRDEIHHAKEMLLFTSGSLCVPIVSFDGVDIGNGRPGPIAAWLKDALLDFLLRTGTQF